MGVYTFPKSICPKVKVIARLEDELAVHRFNHYTTRTPPIQFELEKVIFRWLLFLISWRQVCRWIVVVFWLDYFFQVVDLWGSSAREGQGYPCGWHDRMINYVSINVRPYGFQRVFLLKRTLKKKQKKTNMWKPDFIWIIYLKYTETHI